MIRGLSDRMVSAFRRFVEEPAGKPQDIPALLQVGENAVAISSVRVGARRLFLVEAEGDADLPAIAALFRRQSAWLPDVEAGLQEVVVAVAGPSVAGSQQEIIRLGVRAVPLHRAIADVVGLPTGWQDGQESVISQILEPLRVGAEYRTARLRVPEENGEPAGDALTWISESLGQGASAGRLIYFRAEAGKGKSTTFAELARDLLSQNFGPVPLLVPLRNLRRGAGASWEDIAGTVGVVGAAVMDLGRAVKTGLIVIMLDGLDEVSGRYDPSVIQQVVRVVSEQVRGDHALLAFSGRTTEGMLLDPKSTYQRTIELPAIEGGQFRTYVEGVVDAVVPGWPALAPHVGEPISSTQALPNREFTHADREHVVHWVLHSFTDFGKDRSLFFVQSLACLARDMQLRGNKPIYVKQAESAPRVLLCGLFEACLCAASLACVREQVKVVQDAQSIFTPARQLDVATWLAVLASVDASVRAGFPTPNELIAKVFHLDPVNQAEDLVAIIRQMQKHALLYSSGGLAGGEWRPGFLSEWVRAALLVRAWRNRGAMGEGLGKAISHAIAVAQRARIAFHYIFPDWLARANEVSLPSLTEALISESRSPEACANFWFLMQGLSDELRGRIVSRPTRVVEWTDFSEFEFEGLEFGSEFSANLGMFVRAQFIGCRFTDCKFTQCDFTDASFVSCTFDNVQFEHCDGPMHFENCDEMRSTRFAEVAAHRLPAWMFSHCHFSTGAKLEQTRTPCNSAYGPIATFEECTCEADPASVLVGPELGQDRRRFAGLRLSTAVESQDPGVECLRQLLRPFFPSRVGESGTHQARDYIRSSALGRGVFPQGSPSPSELTNLLSAEGFTRGGRQGHIYAPWSDVAGSTRVHLRSEFSAFLRNQASRGPTIQALLDKIRRSAGW